MIDKELLSRLEAARAALSNQAMMTIQNDDGNGDPRFESFHWGFSLCSQKVRLTLSEKGLPYRSNDMSFKEFDNYQPGYVRLRMYAAKPEKLRRLAQKHTMRTSVETEGFDACVVPLLIDHEHQRAVVDSHAIVKYIDEQSGPAKLIPENEDLAREVEKQLEINDRIPHPGILYGFHKNDPRPDFYIPLMDGIYDRKRAALENLIEGNESDPDLVRVYKAKITKEMAGKKLQKDPVYMAQIMDEFRALIRELDGQLAAQQDGFVCGPHFTLADAMWAISLYRIQWLGHGHLWADYPRVGDYAHRMYQRPAFRKTVIEWPYPMPGSPHTADVDRAA